jgi:hypothetical protein
MNATANVIIYLTPEEADVFTALKQSNALEIKYGKVILNFAGGFLQNVVREEMLWKR